MATFRPNQEQSWGETNNPFREANKLPILEVIQNFLPSTNLTSRTIVCPFPFHKGGNENSASFSIDTKKNNFYCFGCQSSGQAINFVKNLLSCTPSEALSLLQTKQYSHSVVPIFEQNKEERFELLLSFSNKIKIFREQSEEHSLFTEELSEVFDSLYAKHELTNDALREIVSQLFASLESYEPSNSW